MILVHSSNVAAICCQLPATSNPKTVGRMCYAILGMIGLTSHHSTNYNHQSWPSLQQTPLGKHQSATANHRPGKSDTLSKHASAKPDKLSQHANYRQDIPACIAKDTVKKGLQEPRTAE